MRVMFDFIKEIGIALDGLWINSGGHEIQVIHPAYLETPVYYAFYDMPKIGQCSMFGNQICPI